jgi:hypothetical protein
MSRAMPALHIHAFVAWTETTIQSTARMLSGIIIVFCIVTMFVNLIQTEKKQKKIVMLDVHSRLQRVDKSSLLDGMVKIHNVCLLHYSVLYKELTAEI